MMVSKGTVLDRGVTDIDAYQSLSYSALRAEESFYSKRHICHIHTCFMIMIMIDTVLVTLSTYNKHITVALAQTLVWGNVQSTFTHFKNSPYKDINFN